MRRSIRWFLILVLALDTVGAALLLTGVLSSADAVAQAPAEEPAEERPVTRDALEMLSRELAARAEQLRLRETELVELMRSVEVERRLAELQAAAETGSDEDSSAPETSDSASFAFEKLQKAYENMEPESAASTLAELADIDREAVLGLLEGWKPRTSGAILDALTQSHPALAAELSYEIWKRSGKNGAGAATAGR